MNEVLDERYPRIGHIVSADVLAERIDGRIGRFVSPEIMAEQARRMARGDQGPARIDDLSAELAFVAERAASDSGEPSAHGRGGE